MRLFTAINFNEFSDYFKELQKQLPEAKHTLPRQFHLTLKFLGDVDEDKVEEIKQKLSEIKFDAFECELNSVGYFSESFLRTVFVKLECKEISGLQKQVDEKLNGLFKKDSRFEAHITIARIKWVRNKKDYFEALKGIKTEKLTKKVSSFELIKSELTPEGPVYEVLGQFKAIPQPL